MTPYDTLALALLLAGAAQWPSGHVLHKHQR
jgi:hypothetical protein